MALTALTGCAGSRLTSTPVKRDLPPEPAFAREVHVKHQATDDRLIAAGRERAGRQQANDIIVCFVDWYRKVRETYGREQADLQASAINQRCADKGK